MYQYYRLTMSHWLCGMWKALIDSVIYMDINNPVKIFWSVCRKLFTLISVVGISQKETGQTDNKSQLLGYSLEWCDGQTVGCTECPEWRIERQAAPLAMGRRNATALFLQPSNSNNTNTRLVCLIWFSNWISPTKHFIIFLTFFWKHYQPSHTLAVFPLCVRTPPLTSMNNS